MTDKCACGRVRTAEFGPLLNAIARHRLKAECTYSIHAEEECIRIRYVGSDRSVFIMPACISVPFDFKLQPAREWNFLRSIFFLYSAKYFVVIPQYEFGYYDHGFEATDESTMHCERAHISDGAIDRSLEQCTVGTLILSSCVFHVSARTLPSYSMIIYDLGGFLTVCSDLNIINLHLIILSRIKTYIRSQKVQSKYQRKRALFRLAS